MTPGDMLVVLDHALAKGHRGRYRLHLTAPVVLGVHGVYTGDKADGTMGDYGYTKRACKAIRKAILDAARADALSPPVREPEWPSYAPSETE